MIEKLAIVFWIIATLSAVYFFWCLRQFMRDVTPYLHMQERWERHWVARGGVAILAVIIAAVAAWVLS